MMLAESPTASSPWVLLNTSIDHCPCKENNAMTFRYHFVLPLCCVLALAGCRNENSPDAPPSTEQPESVGIDDQVSLIVKLRDEIRDGFTSGDVDAAHGPLHDVGDKLDELSNFAAGTERSQEEKQAIEGHIKTLFDAFGNIDKTLHGQEGSTWEEEADTINEAMEKLVQACKTNG